MSIRQPHTSYFCDACNSIFSHENFYKPDYSHYCKDCVNGDYEDWIIDGWWDEKPIEARIKLWTRLLEERKQIGKTEVPEPLLDLLKEFSNIKV